MMGWVMRLQRWRERIERWVWAVERDGNARVRYARVLATVVMGTVGDRIWLRAGNMTYLSLLHLVPVGALALALARGLGWQETLVNWIKLRLSPTAPDLASRLVAAMDRIDVVAIGYAGLAAIILASVVALSELEVDLGEVYECEHPRHWRRRVWLYPLAIVLAPTLLTGVLLLGALAEARTTALMQVISSWGAVGAWVQQWLTRLPLLFELVPYVLTWGMFTALYRLATPAPIGWRAAAIGGIFAGVVWQLAQGVYIGFQLGVSTYREIWGYLAQIPLLLIWIYASWGIVFVGAEVVYAWENRLAYMPKWRSKGLLSFESIHRVTVRVAAKILQSVEASGQPAKLAVISGQARIPLPIVRQCARKLGELGLVQSDRDEWIPSAALVGTTIGELGVRLRRLGEAALPMTGESPLTDDLTIRQVAKIETRLPGDASVDASS